MNLCSFKILKLVYSHYLKLQISFKISYDLSVLSTF